MVCFHIPWPRDCLQNDIKLDIKDKDSTVEINRWIANLAKPDILQGPMEPYDPSARLIAGKLVWGIANLRESLIQLMLHSYGQLSKYYFSVNSIHLLIKKGKYVIFDLLMNSFCTQVSPSPRHMMSPSL